MKPGRQRRRRNLLRIDNRDAKGNIRLTAEKGAQVLEDGSYTLRDTVMDEMTVILDSSCNFSSAKIVKVRNLPLVACPSSTLTKAWSD
jgi:hypothetical protein